MSTRYHSGLKAQRQNVTRNLRNKAAMSALKTQVKKTTQAIEAGKKDVAGKELPEMFSILDKAVKSGRMHKNTVARKKARLVKKFTAIKQG